MTASSNGKPSKLVLFDIDGTILSTHGAGRRAIRKALIEELGATGPIEKWRFDGKTDPQIVMELMDAAQHPRRGEEHAVVAVCDRYTTLLETELITDGVRVKVLPGVSILLDALESLEDVVLGLLTGNVVRGAELKLTAGGIDPKRFRVGAFGSDQPVRADLPEVAAERATALMDARPSGNDLVIVGDTPADMRCGESLEARAVGVATGRFTVRELIDAGAYAAFDDLSDTPKVLEAILA